MNGVGILGGTFDPPHDAHVAMARSARETLGLSEVLLVPACVPPHKISWPLTPFSLRLAMTRAAVAAVDGVGVSDMEAVRSGPSFTVDLLRACKQRFAQPLYFIIGADSLRDLPSWRDPEGILALATLVVFPRDGIPVHLAVGGNASLVVFEHPVIEISSSAVRARSASGRPSGDVAQGVQDIVEANGLYRKDS